ncbi:hypothetical protein KJ359_011658 [Pestalotiopsis sp. 9143b]|nr:hypothetical protein KJ359_011658 [Pestalotiopsis sp. 9143b]
MSSGAGGPGPCESCARRKADCVFSQVRLPRRPNTNVKLMSTPSPEPRPKDAIEVDSKTAGPVPESYVDRLLANARRPDLLNRDRRVTVKRNGLFLANFSLTFFSDARLEQLSKRLGNDKVNQLVSRISSVIRLRVRQHDKLSASSLRIAAGSVFEASTNLIEANAWIQSYFERVHPFYPFLDRKDFESRAFNTNLPTSLVQDKAWSALYHAVLALGCQANGGGSFEPGKGEAWRLFSVSLGLFPDLITLPDSLAVLNAMAAMTVYSLGISCLAIEHVIISEAARRAQNLGSSRLTGEEENNYHKVFWVLYSMEKISSFHFGRNSVFNDHDIVFPIPPVPEAVINGFDWFLACASCRLSLSRATLFLAADAPEVVSKAQQSESTKALMESSRSTLELTTYIDVEPYTHLWIIGGIPLTAHFTLFDLVINNSSFPGTAANLALLDISAGHFSRIEYGSDGHLPGSLIAEFTHIAREYVQVTAQGQPSTDAVTLARTSDTSITTGALGDSDPDMIPAMNLDETLAPTTEAPLEMSYADMLYFPIGQEFIGSTDNNLMGIDIMDLFNTYIPGIDPMFFNNQV